MDFNQLYSDHQALLMKAARAPTLSRRRALEVSASHIAGRIGCMQRALGAAAAPIWEMLAAAADGSLAAPHRHQQGYAW